MQPNPHAPEIGSEAVPVALPPPTVSASDQWLSSYTDDVLSVGEYCRKHGILSDVKTAIDLIRKHYAKVQNIKIGLSDDPEGDSEWLVVEFDTTGSIESVVDASTRLNREWVATAQARGMASIRFLYNIL